IRFSRPIVPHTMFLLEGEIDAAGAVAPREGAVIVEHNADVTLRAKRPTRLLHFHRPESHPERTSKAGGHVHTGGPNGTFKTNLEAERPIRVWLNSTCPTCEIWLHRARPVPPHHSEAVHYHTADEIIFVLRGSIMLGRKELGAG